jgi:hypothetical protein
LITFQLRVIADHGHGRRTMLATIRCEHVPCLRALLETRLKEPIADRLRAIAVSAYRPNSA